MNKFLSALNTPVVQHLYEKSLMVVLLLIAFGLAGLPLYLLALVPIWLHREPADQRNAESEIDALGATDMV